ncbi:SDR family NAD(P)-dependent oxidoreductase, partial [Desulfocucumis palustris]|uniref:SDR family NAD(P)-dependent oxidoreductase n=1 Tax=Desulfocucumis palustris TaxID=1898651 RepID=UPI0035A25A1C
MVYGQTLLPGLAYIDMLYQLAKDAMGLDYRKYCLKRLSIYNPLIVTEERSVKLIIYFDKTPRCWNITVEDGEADKQGNLSKNKLYITAELHEETIMLEEKINIEAMKQAATQCMDIETLYAEARKRGLLHQGMIKAKGNIYLTDPGCLIEVNVDNVYHYEAESFLFHPALIDGAAIASGGILAGKGIAGSNEDLYLPLYYESFSCMEPLQTHCYAKVSLSSLRMVNDIRVNHIAFFNKEGKQIAHLKGITVKRIRMKEQITPGLKKETISSSIQGPSVIAETFPQHYPEYSGGINTAPADIEVFLQKIFSKHLKRPASQIDLCTGFFELGMESSRLLAVVQDIERAFDLSLNPTLLFEYTTIAELSAYLNENYASQFNRHSTVTHKVEQGQPGNAVALDYPPRQAPIAEQASVSHAGGENNQSQGALPAVSPVAAMPASRGEIAIIGMAGRYPGAKNLRDFWMNLKAGSDCISEIPKSRWDWHRFEGLRSPSGKEISRWGGLIDDPECFDPQFFRISPREAELLDPQERLFLEACWEAMEDAGYTPKTLVKPLDRNKSRYVGVFVGVMHKDYTLIGAEAVSRGQVFPVSLNSASIANRVSYFCNFHGPSMVVDTLCSSSLTAVHLALESVRSGESEVALAGGVNLSLHPNKYLSYGLGDLHSSDGYCRTFGKGGDGYVSGEGIGAILLKPLHKAIQDRDHIYAVIKGSSINHGGTVSGISVPSPAAQADLIIACMEKSGLDPRTISYVEAHGTGTSLGDPIEIQGLVKAFRYYTQDRQFCSIGSVKSNIGHTESAAGISGLHKVVLQLYYKTLVPSLHSEELNPFIDLENSPFYIQHKTQKWEQPLIMKDDRQVSYPRRAGLSSFGAAGANAHVILEEYIPQETGRQNPVMAGSQGKPAIIPLSAKNQERLYAYAKKLLGFLRGMSRGKKTQQSMGENKTKFQTILEIKIRQILSGILQVEEEAIEIEQEWDEFGIEPVQVMLVKEKLQEEFKLDIHIKELLQRNSIASVVTYIMNHHQKAIEAHDLMFGQSEIATGTETEEPETVPGNNEINLFNLAYTLQVGREAMEERVAFIVKDIPELMDKLEAFAEAKESIDNCWRGRVKHSKETIDFPGTDQDSLELIHKWVTKGNLRKIVELWVRGFSMEWELFYGEAKPQRISLPTYPFAREPYWVPGNKIKSAGGTAITPAVDTSIHPLLHQNTSDLWEQRFSSTFTGGEFFLMDHLVKGRRVLPGVAYLEMARAAVVQATGALEEGQARVQLKNVVWIQTIAVGEQPVRVHIGLFPGDNGEIGYRIYSQPEGAEAEPVIHGQGSAVLSPLGGIPTLDLKALRAKCSQSVLSSAQCYEAFKLMGFDYGPGHRGIERVHTGQEQVLARLSLPSCVSDGQAKFVLHPGMLDSALQASIGLMAGADNLMSSSDILPHNPPLPFVLQELEVLGKCAPAMWAFIRPSEGGKAGDKVQKLDIDLCDDQGTICVRMKGFSSRILEGEPQTGSAPKSVTPKTSTEPLVGAIMLLPVWDSVPVEKGQTFPSPTDRLMIVGGTEDNRSAIQQLYPKAQVLEIQPEDTMDEIAKKLEAHGSIDHILWIAPHRVLLSLAEDTLLEEQNKGVLQVFRMIKGLLRLGYGNRNLGWSVITIQAQPIHKNDSVNPAHASIHGLIGSMVKEYPNWKVRLIDLEADCEWPLADIFTLPTDHQGRTWVYRSRCWYRQQLIPFRCSRLNQTLYKLSGVYVVIGGAGGIGEAWSEYMIRTYQARIIWIGRRRKTASIQAKLDRLAGLGPAPHYIAADATDPKALQQAYEEIKQQYSHIHGVVHSAMVLLEQSLADMEEEEFQAVLSAKVDVSVRMAQVFNKEHLDFVLFFSSLMAVTKAPRQSNYASGCTFKDAFAHQLSQVWPCAVKVINWGYWGSGQIDDFDSNQPLVQTYLRLAEIGVGLIEPPEAMETLERLLAGPLDQIGLIKITKPLAIEGMNTEELISVYPENLSPGIQSIRNRIPEQDKQIVKSEMIRYTTEVDNFLCRLLLGQLQSMGLFTERNPVIADFKTKAGLREIYSRWLEESILVLTRNNYLQCDGVSCALIDKTPIDIDAVWNEWELKKRQWPENPGTGARVALVEAAMRALPEILTGKVLAIDIMFPNSSMELAEGIYKHNPVADYSNEILVNTVVAYIQERLKQDSSAAIRILEVGTGTGGTGAMVFQKLKPYRHNIQEYCYTDISKELLIHAEKEYGPQNPYLTYQLFNVEAPIAEQGIRAGGYDIVIAANVLYITKNIRQTLRNIKAALKKNGLILLNAMTGNALFNHLTFGLLDAWWLYDAPELRIPGCPGLSPETWQAVLESEGLRRVFFPVREAYELGGQIIVAESDGIVRQKQQLKPVLTPVRNKVKTNVAPNELPPERQPGGHTQDLLREKSTAYLKKLVGVTLKIPSHSIDSAAPLEKYGIDSISVVHMTNNLRKVLKNISTTLFFEYQTIDALVEHFMKTQKDSLTALVGFGEQELHERISNGDEILVKTSPPGSRLAFRKSGRFLQFHQPEIKGPASQPPGIQDIAIIGLSGRYPGANDVDEFWNNLREGRNCITEIPKNRWDWKEYFDQDKGKRGSIYTKWGGFIKDIDKFDPLFFHISPAEAEQMDPQERLFLEVVYASIEDTGYTPANLCESRKVGVFVGVMNGNYPTGTSYWSIANRISYLLNFQGPSMAVDTACSSSLTAIHLALESLYSGMSECSIAGGVNLIVDPVHYLRLAAATMLSSGDQCKSFGAQADGFVDGEGVGAIILKPLQKAMADGDHIYGIIKGSMLNAGGKTNGYMVPNPNAQFQLIAEALQRAGVHPRTISYLEAHGTGTSLGDPIEVAGLTRAFEQNTKDKQFCAIGSVKSNIGHCESAAGIAGVTKVLLQLKHRQLVPSLNSSVPNPNIDFGSTPFVVQQELVEWKRPVAEINGESREYPRIAGISSFGAGGANAHVIIEEYIPGEQQPPSVAISPGN